MRKLFLISFFLLCLLLAVAFGNSYFYKISGEVAAMKEEIKELQRHVALLKSEVTRLNRLWRIEKEAIGLGLKYLEGGEDLEVLAIKIPDIYHNRIRSLSPLPPFLPADLEAGRETEKTR
jgi:hypothetical protein